MALVSRGRLSVQRVDKEAWDTLVLLAERGGWEELNFGKGKAKPNTAKGAKGARASPRKKKRKADEESTDYDQDDDSENHPADSEKRSTSGHKRKAKSPVDEGDVVRRSTRSRK
jgi:hypothetical protein